MDLFMLKIKGTTSPLYSNFAMWSNPLEYLLLRHFVYVLRVTCWTSSWIQINPRSLLSIDILFCIIPYQNHILPAASHTLRRCHLKTITFQCIYIWFWYATIKSNWSFQTVYFRSQNCFSGGVGGLRGKQESAHKRTNRQRDPTKCIMSLLRALPWA